ncbi:hypothetical protein [Sporolactobacillus vineae]|uniref:hypothetical protein n=1 Tax=Sporolactobacillus vineae TaxID=444463 RepID=UPI0002885873|nr:hypothetical protein [Sporolactobacillus vineae]
MWFTESECIHAMKIASEYLSFSFTRNEYTRWQRRHKEYPTAAQIAQRLHGFNEAKVQAGLIPHATIETSRLFSDDQLIRTLRRYQREIGDPFTAQAYEVWRQKQTKAPSVSTLRKRFGSIAEIRKRLALPPAEDVLLDSDEKWLGPLAGFIASRLSPAAYQDWAAAHQAPSIDELRRYAGSYDSALAEAIERFLQQLKE